MNVPQVVIDTNVLISALRSLRGASYRLFSLISSGRFEIYLSVPLVLEYEEVSKRQLGPIPLTPADIDDLVNYLCRVANKHAVFYAWRPFLADPEDDMVLELAVTARCDVIVTYNTTDFRGVEQFGIRALTPLEFLREIGEVQ
jgi:putative PIN family toxin of toxin-antitoxin system